MKGVRLNKRAGEEGVIQEAQAQEMILLFHSVPMRTLYYYQFLSFLVLRL